MFGNNVIMLEGNLTNDPEHKDISGAPLTSFRIGVNERISEDKEETLFIDVDAWYERSEACQNSDFSRGDRILVLGTLRERTWQDQEGKTRSKMSVVAKTVSLVKKKPVKTGSF
jgi:single-strand DNA-binding protein